MSLDVPSHGQAVSGQFAVAGGAVDLGASAGSGVDTVHVWAQSTTTGEWHWIGAAGMGVSRPDVGAVFGAQFSASGFAMMGSLAPGTYDINVFAHSLVSGTFNNVQTKGVKYIPFITKDTPAPTHLNQEILEKYREKMRPFYYDPTKFPTYLDQLGIKYPTLRTTPQ